MAYKAYFRNYIQGDIYNVLSPAVIELYHNYNINEKYIDIKLSWTLCDGNKALGCAGFTNLWTNLYECWLTAISLDIFQKHKLLVIKKIQYEMKHLKAERIQAYVDVSTYNCEHLMKVLGFINEGLLRKYGPNGEDYYIYGLVK